MAGRAGGVHLKYMFQVLNIQDPGFELRVLDLGLEALC